MEGDMNTLQPTELETIDPTLRAHIYGLVSALGGPSPDNPDIYLLGDDVLGCLRDIKRWLKGYDEKLNRFDVSRCLSEANMVVGDILEILSHSLSASTSTPTYPNKISVACVELLVPLTWPLDRTELSMTINHHRHMAVLKRSQLYYKQAILAHRSRAIIKACCVNALPAMMIAPLERTARDEGIIRLVLYFIRNLLQVGTFEDENDEIRNNISRSSTIESFDAQGVFSLLISVISGIPELFEQQDVTVLEVIFYLIQGIELQQIISPIPEPGNVKHLDPLSQMLRKEGGLKDAHQPHSRHNRFGTTVLLRKENGQKTVISGPGALLNEDYGLQRLDATKKWRKPQRISGNQRSILGTKVQLNPSAQKYLRRFLVQMLKSGFNSLFLSSRKAIERDSERVLSATHSTQLFYVGGVMMELFRMLSRNNLKSEDSDRLDIRDLSCLLHAETFIILFRHIREGLELKSWDDVQAGCLYFTQILLVAAEMAYSKDPQQNLAAENILNRLFYEETLQDLMVMILKSGHGRSLQYLDAATEMIHVYLRTLERYSKQNTNMVVKSKRIPKSRSTELEAPTDSDEDITSLHRPRQAEKHFDFLRCEAKFLSPAALETFLDLLRRYKEIDHSQVKRCIGFLHRVFVKRGDNIGLFRLKPIFLLHNIARDTKGLPEYSEVGIFVQYFTKQLARKLAEYPILFVELLFQKSVKTSYFLQNGRDKDFRPPKKRFPPALEFVDASLSKEDQIAIAISLILQDDKCKNELVWIELALNKITESNEGKQQTSLPVEARELAGSLHSLTEPPTIVIKIDDPERALLHLSSNKLQLLMRVLDFVPEGRDQDEFAYTLTSKVTAAGLRGNLVIFLKYKNNTIFNLGGDAIEAYVQIKQRQRAETTEKSSHGDNEERNWDYSEDDDFEFPDNLNGGGLQQSRNKGTGYSSRQKRKLDEDELAARREERKRKERERRKGIKSALYIASSDDDSDIDGDPEFFEKERKLREAMSKATIEAIGSNYIEGDAVQAATKKRSSGDAPARQLKRARTTFSDSQSDEHLSDSEAISVSNAESEE
ncbi:hypothetical protein ABW20_dc0100868 [Dactylellina cionopaga]|nr:hypothetical protein ABW20_dc0100868 [Dactylellina cionopaga]